MFYFDSDGNLVQLDDIIAKHAIQEPLVSTDVVSDKEHENTENEPTTEEPPIEEIPVITEPDPLNILGLPAYTIRLKYRSGYTPSARKGNIVCVSEEDNVWDLTYQNSNWSQLLYHDLVSSSVSPLLEVLGANTTGVTDMSYLFCGNNKLTRIQIFDTRSVTNMNRFCMSCRSLLSIPLFPTENVTDCSYAFYSCYSVQTGATALYQQMSTQAKVPTTTTACFLDCGDNEGCGWNTMAGVQFD